MPSKLSKADKKITYDAKLCQLLDEYSQILIVAADNVGSTQLQNIRKGLRGDSVVLMGKNTMMKRTVRIHAEKTGNLVFLNLIPLLVVRINLVTALYYICFVFYCGFCNLKAPFVVYCVLLCFWAIGQCGSYFYQG